MKRPWHAALVTVAFALFSVGSKAQDPSRPQASTSAMTVNDLAAKPDEHLGAVQLVGVVAAISNGKGFVLVDPREYAACGLSCLAEAGTAKIPVRWSGEAPKLEQTLRVTGTLSRTDRGLTFMAQELRSP